MLEQLIPKEVNISSILLNKTLSPKKYAKIDIPNSSKESIKSFLNSEKPYFKGEEPGSFSYVQKSKIAFVRNSCINSSDYSNVSSKEIYLNPNFGYSNTLHNEDILLCKDANIGDTCLFISESEKEYIFSSGIVKLNIDDEFIKYYLLAFLRDSFFQSQLDSKTPRGSTMRHAGNSFLSCMIPKIDTAIELFLPIIQSLIKNISYAENYSFKKLNTINELIDAELLVNEVIYSNPSISSMIQNSRIDAGYYSETTQEINYNIQRYFNGFSNIYNLGFSIKRGPNLQKRDLGRSIKSNSYKPNYHLLVYPSDISDSGYITKQVFIGARNPVWYLKPGDILFSAEGTVGKTFIICQDDLKFITNIHGIIISQNKDGNLNNAIMLGVFLNYLKAKQFIQKITVGGQGGSLAVNYWEHLQVPIFSENFINQIAPLYHSLSILNPLIFNINQLESAGIYELNNFRILCKEILSRIIFDIKNDCLNDLLFYKDFYKI